MNSKIKIALALLGTGTLIWGLRKRKNNKLKTFTAPDGNTYKENQMYRTNDNKVFKNGKEMRFTTPIPDSQNSSANIYNNTAENGSKNYQAVNKNVNYHQKGVRHH
ncbi:hypothetical protein MKJ01_15140 [Chryseobacterium sp. SSA4.19]|uniref:hypothetical protein n=1 Tax=Chryseobacterium sp. SSA4.19 TaxID=2919915 RepID=UPI001F4DF628|nr:hypothetical protein [Chryseobacterium sp. SSA4.19]MCJ8155102.1 hypothetical protein [Chryseobacterium sp. SSA4.19]